MNNTQEATGDNFQGQEDEELELLAQELVNTFGDFLDNNIMGID